MKLFGKELEQRGIETVVIPRPTEDIIFKLRPVDFKDFLDICPEPKAKTRVNADGSTETVSIEKELVEWAEKKTSYMVIYSLLATEGFSWETVDLNKPETWKGYYDEMIQAGISDMELAKIVEGVTKACGMSSDKIDEAYQSFLASQGQIRSQ